MKIGLVGLGYWGSKIANTLLRFSDVEFSFICDTNPKSIYTKRAMFDNIPFEINYEAAILKYKPDAIILATPYLGRDEIVKNICKYGINIWMEKPFAISLVDLNNLTSIFHNSKSNLFVDYTYLHSEGFLGFLKLFNNGVQGNKIKSVVCRRSNLGIIRKDMNVIWDLMVHDLSMLLQLFNLQPKNISTIALKDNISPTFSTVSTHFLSEDSLFEMHASWTSPSKERIFQVIHDKGSILFDDTASSDKLITIESNIEQKSSDELSINYFTGLRIIHELGQKESLENALEYFIRNQQNNDMKNKSLNLSKKITEIGVLIENSIIKY